MTKAVKGRYLRKLNQAKADQIRCEFDPDAPAEGRRLQEYDRLAAKFGVSQETIARIILGAIWTRKPKPGKEYGEMWLHKRIVELLHLNIRPDVKFFHPPNGGLRGPVEAANFKAMGVSPGVPDLCFVMPDGETRWMEIKALKKGKLEDAQKEWHDFLNRVKQRCVVVWSLEEAIEILTLWGVFKSQVKIAA